MQREITVCILGTFGVLGAAALVAFALGRLLGECRVVDAQNGPS
jgi:hypothetical protein